MHAPRPETIIEHSTPVSAPQPGQAVIVITPRKIAAVLSASACILAGLYLLMVEPASKDNQGNMLFIIAHGMGLYFIGKGIFCGAELIGPQSVAFGTVPLVPMPVLQRGRIHAALRWAGIGVGILLLVSIALAALFPGRFVGPAEFLREHLGRGVTGQ